MEINMDIKTAFYWDVKDKKICYLACDLTKNEINLLIEPTKINIDINDFENQANSVIQNYFDQIIDFQPQNIKIEYRILASGSPAQVFQKYRKSDYSEIIKDTFESLVKKNNTHVPIDLKKQIKSILTGDSLEQFKIILSKLGLINTIRKDAYKWHLWSILIHATNSNYQEKIRKELWRPLMDSINSSRDNEKRYEEWLEQALTNV
jgi:hypothetical protein